MKRGILIMAIAASLLSCCSPAKVIPGTWKVSSMEIEGQDEEGRKATEYLLQKGFILVFRSNGEMQIKFGDNGFSAGWSLSDQDKTLNMNTAQFGIGRTKILKYSKKEMLTESQDSIQGRVRYTLLKLANP
jgi:hypothetical protein